MLRLAQRGGRASRRLHQLAQHVVRARLRLLDARDVLRARDDHVVGEPAPRPPARRRSRRARSSPARAAAPRPARRSRCRSCRSSRARAARRPARRRRSPGARRSRRSPMSLASAVMIAGSSVRSSARRAGQPPAAARGSRRRRPSRRSPSRRCRARAACRPRRAARAGPRPPRAASSRPSVSVCARSAPTSSAFISTDAATSAITASRSVSLLAQERVEEARRAGVVDLPRVAALEQPAVLEEHVHELPQQVVERLGQLLAHERVRRSAAPTRSGRQIARQPRSRGRRDGGARLLGGLERDHDVLGRDEQRDLRGQRPALAREPDRRQRALADDHRVDELDRDVARVRARRRRGAERHEPPAAREALRHRGGRAARCGRPRRRRSGGWPPSARRAAPRLCRSAAPGLTPGRPPASRAARGSRGTPRPPPPCAR